MRKSLLLAAAAVVLSAASLSAQDERPEFPEPMSDSLYAATRTQEMVEAYALTPGQEGPVFELNLLYAGKLDMRPGRPEGEMGERKDPRSMTDAERQEFFQKMQERMSEMQERMEEVSRNQKAYDAALKEILTKDQFKAYRKDRRKKESEMQSRMQRGPGMGGPGMGGPGGRGGFGGPGGRGGFGGFED